MSRTRSLISAMAIAASASLVAADDIWTSQGPADLGAITHIAIVDAVAYAGTWNGVFRSDDGGVRWRPSGLAGERVHRVVARSGASAFFAMTDSGALYASRNGGESWARLELPPLRDFAIDATVPSTVYAAPWDAYPLATLRSTDSGASWEELSLRVANGLFQFLPVRDAIYVLSVRQVHKSVDRGLSWTNVPLPIEDPRVIAAGVPEGVLYLADHDSFCKSIDAATTWSCSVVDFLADHILEVPGDDVARPRLFVTTDSSVLRRSLDGGASWEQVPGFLGALVAHPAVDSIGSLMLVGAGGGSFRSANHGDSWEFSSGGLLASEVSEMAVDPRDSSRLWAEVDAGTRRRFMHSGDAGESWSLVDASRDPAAISSLLTDPRNPSRRYAIMDAGSGWGIFRSENAGQSWTPGVAMGAYPRSLSLDPHDPDTLWAISGTTLRRSDDRGESHTTVPTIDQSVYTLIFDGRRPVTIYAGSYFEIESSGYDSGLPRGGSIFVSRDAGANWSQNRRDFGSPVRAIATDPFEDGILYVGTARSGVHRSLDDGASWQATLAGATVQVIAADPTRLGHIYAATNEGFFRSTDRAATWLPFSSGLPPALSVTSLVLTPDGRRLHAATSGGGIYKRDLVAACVPSETRLCLSGGRYALDLVAGRRGEPATTPGTARPLADRGGYFSLPFVTGDARLPEVVVKVLGDGALGVHGSPVFYTSLTTLPYVLTVTDTFTGEQETYRSNSAQPLCGAVDIAFEPEGALAPGPRDDKSAAGDLPLLSGRFSLALSARHPRTGAVTAGHAIASADRYGFFTLPGFTSDPALPEVIVKMLDFRPINGTFLVFFAGLTSADYTLTLTDTVTRATRTYESPGDYCGNVAFERFED